MIENEKDFAFDFELYKDVLGQEVPFVLARNVQKASTESSYEDVWGDDYETNWGDDYDETW